MTFTDDRHQKRTTANMGGMRPRKKEEITAGKGKTKTFGKISAITRESGEKEH